MRTSKSYRIIIMADECGYEHGDYENDEQRAEVEEAIERDGLWCYVVEKRIDGKWQHVGSCSGFIGTDIHYNGMADHLANEIPAGYDVPVFDVYGSESYDWYRKPAKRKRNRKPKHNRAA